MSGVQGHSIGSINSDWDWRVNRPGREQKLAYILENNQFSDVTFRLGNATNHELIHAHRLVLSMYSSVFESMFHGPLAEKRDDVIDVPDISPNAFHSLLKFVYSEEFDRDLIAEDALGLLYAAKKYLINDLVLVCTDHLKNRIIVENAVSVFQTAQLLDVDDLKDEGYAFIKRNFDAISKTEDFLEITKENLCLFLQDDETRGAELEIFQGVLRWGNAECTRQKLESTPGNRRLVLKDAISLVRFLIISSEDIALQVVPSGVLTPQESTLVFQHLVVPSDTRSILPKICFSGKKRNCSTYMACFYDGMAKTAYVDISAGWFNKFCVDQPISIVSFGFYGPHSADAASYEISIKLLRDSSEEVLGEVLKVNVVAKMQEIFHIKFHRPIPILPGNKYRAWFSLKGPLTCHGVSTSHEEEVIVPVNFTKFQSVKFTYSVTGAHQLPQIAFQI